MTSVQQSSDNNAPLKARPTVIRAKTPGLVSESSDIQRKSSAIPKDGGADELKRRPSMLAAMGEDPKSHSRRPSNLRRPDSENGFILDEENQFTDDTNNKQQELITMLEKQRKELIAMSDEGMTRKLSKKSSEVGRNNSQPNKSSDAPTLSRKSSFDGSEAIFGKTIEKSGLKSEVNQTPRNLLEISSDAKARWKMAFAFVRRILTGQRGIRAGANMQFIESSKSIIDYDGTKNSNSTSAAKADTYQGKMIEILSKPIMYRTSEQITALDMILRTYPGFSRYSKSFRSKLIDKSSLFEVGGQRVIIKQGHKPSALYFLISGKCRGESVIVRHSKGYIRRRDINLGDVFGEFSMVNESEPRVETVYTQTFSVLLMIYRDVYVDLMRSEIASNKSNLISGLQEVSAFRSISPSILEKIINSSQMFKMDPNVILLRANERNNVTFILEGQCRVNRLVPFLMKNGEVIGSHKVGTIPPSNEEVVLHNLSVGMLGPGDFFPKISLLRNEALDYRLQKIALEKIILLLKAVLDRTGKKYALDVTSIGSFLNIEVDELTNELEETIAAVDLSVTSVDHVTCLTISKMDLVNIVTEETLKEITDPSNEGLLGFKIEEIQKNYFEKIKWKKYRNEVINDLGYARS